MEGQSPPANLCFTLDMLFTIIVLLSSLQDEAFSIWQDWSYLYPVGSASRKLLQDIGEEMWLVSIVHHDYKDPDALGRFLLGDKLA